MVILFKRMWSVWLLIGAILLPLPCMASDGGSQLFGKKDDEKDAPLKKAQKTMVKKEADIQKSPKPVLTKRKKIESVIPVRRLPNGWVFRDELLA
ncbi:uncharacterized protein METZ01_LOCUS370358, partial [marine metagenome]